MVSVLCLNSTLITVRAKILETESTFLALPILRQFFTLQLLQFGFFIQVKDVLLYFDTLFYWLSRFAVRRNRLVSRIIVNHELLWFNILLMWVSRIVLFYFVELYLRLFGLSTKEAAKQYVVKFHIESICFLFTCWTCRSPSFFYYFWFLFSLHMSVCR